MGKIIRFSLHALMVRPNETAEQHWERERKYYEKFLAEDIPQMRLDPEYDPKKVDACEEKLKKILQKT